MPFFQGDAQLKPLAQSAPVAAEEDNVPLAFLGFVFCILLETSHNKYWVFIGTYLFSI